MAVVATETQKFSNVVKHEYAPESAYCREVITMNDAAATISIGAVLGKVTATGKYKLVTVAANDGSQNAVAVVIGNAFGAALPTTLAATTDTKFLVLARGPVMIGKAALQVGADVDTAPELAVVYASLASVGIIAADQI